MGGEWEEEEEGKKGKRGEEEKQTGEVQEKSSSHLNGQL